MPIEIRPAAPTDAPAISALLPELGYPASPAQAGERLSLLTGSDVDRVLVATEDNAVVGVAGVHLVPLLHKSGNSARTTALVVRAAARGRGVGAALMRGAEEFAWAHGCLQIEVTSGTGRDDAHRFYERIGYRQTSRRFIKAREDGSR